jgi:hypothetical protein
MNKRKAKSVKRKVSAKGGSAYGGKVQSLKFLVLSFSFALFVLHFTLSMVFAQPVSSTELINNAKLYDGKIVSYEGEVIGDIMVRGAYAWLNLNDGQNAIGVWINSALVKDIGYTGSYKSVGDGIEVTGVFRRACLEHGGDLDIHAQAIRKTGSGRRLQERLNVDKRNQVFIFLGIIALIWISKLLKRK